MLWLAVICVVLASTGADEVADKTREFKVRAQSIYLDHLDEELTKYEHKVEELCDHPDEKLDHELHARLDHLEEEECHKGYHHCGKGSKQCIHELLFCDDHPDCHNVADEDEERCEGHVLLPGSSFHGLPTWTSCEQHHGQLLGFNVVQKEVVHEHGSKVKVDAVVYWSKETQKFAHGYWSVGSQKLVLDVKGGNLYLVCHFLTDDLADCELKRSKNEVCATVRVHRS